MLLCFCCLYTCLVCLCLACPNWPRSKRKLLNLYLVLVVTQQRASPNVDRCKTMGCGQFMKQLETMWFTWLHRVMLSLSFYPLRIPTTKLCRGVLLDSPRLSQLFVCTISCNLLQPNCTVVSNNVMRRWSLLSSRSWFWSRWGLSMWMCVPVPHLLNC